MKKIFIILLILFITQFAYGQGEVSKVGTTAANFLKLEVGARAVALAGVFTPVTNDIYSLKWNPAGLAQIDYFGVAYSNIQLYAEMSQQFIGLVIPMGGQSSIGFSINYVDVGKIEKTTVYEPDGTDLFFSNFDMDIGLSYARALTDRITIGVTGRYIHEQIWQEKATGFSSDIGIIFVPDVSGLKLGMSITNFGPAMKMDKGPLQTFISYPEEEMIGAGNGNKNARYMVETAALPTSFQLGAAFDIMGKNNMFFNNNSNRISLMVEINDGFDNYMRSKYGVEYEWNNILSLRGGYKENYDLATFSFGGGVKMPVKGMNVRFDYAMAQYGDLGDIHVTSIELGF